MATKTFAPLLGKRIRVTQLNICGEFLAAEAEDAWLATDGFVSVNLSSEVEAGAELVSRKADGSLCVNEKLNDSFKRFNVELTFCDVNPSLLSMISNAEPYEDHGGDVAGFTVPEGEITKKFALELWTGLAGAGCASSGEEASGYALLPYIQSGTVGNIEVTGESTVTFSITGAYTKGGNSWGVGPWEVVYDDSEAASTLPTALDPLDHLLLFNTGLTPPPSAVDPQPMPAG